MQIAIAEAAVHSDYPSELLRLGYPLGVVLGILPDTLELTSEKQMAFEQLVLEQCRANTEPNFGCSVHAYFERVLKGNDVSPKRPIALLKKLFKVDPQNLRLLRRCVGDGIEHYSGALTGSQTCSKKDEISMAAERRVLEQCLRDLRSLSLELLQNPELHSIDASQLVADVLCKLLSNPSSPELLQLVNLARARGVSDEELASLVEQSRVPQAVAEALRPLLGVANSLAEMLDGPNTVKRTQHQNNVVDSFKGGP